MTRRQTIRALLADTGRLAECKAARCAWARETVAALRAADRKVDAAWERIFDALPDELSDERSAQSCRGHDEHWSLEAIPEPPEQAEVDAIHAQIRAAIDEDRWPRELYFGGI
jgi:hypothetical protein